MKDLYLIDIGKRYIKRYERQLKGALILDNGSLLILNFIQPIICHGKKFNVLIVSKKKLYYRITYILQLKQKTYEAKKCSANLDELIAYMYDIFEVLDRTKYNPYPW